MFYIAVGRCVFTRKNACCVCGYLFTLGKYSKSSQFDVLTALGYKLSLHTLFGRNPKNSQSRDPGSSASTVLNKDMGPKITETLSAQYISRVDRIKKRPQY